MTNRETRPEKIIKWLFVQRKKHGNFVDYNGKQLYSYYIEIPYWIARAYSRKNPSWAKVEFCNFSNERWRNKDSEENKEEAREYYLKYWKKKQEKMRKANNGYIEIVTEGLGQSYFKSHEDYVNYHKELKLLNEKYVKK